MMRIVTTLLALLSTLASLATCLQLTSPNGTSVLDYNKIFTVAWNPTADNKNAISIWLYSGYDAGLKQIDTVVSNTQSIQNTYRWSVTKLNGFASGCSYAMLITDGTTRSWGEYFSINNANDGGLPAGTNCTSLATTPRFPSVAASNANGGGETGGGNRAGTGTANGNGNANVHAGNLRPAVWGAIIAAVIVILLAIFALILFCLRRKGYLNKQPKTILPTNGSGSGNGTANNTHHSPGMSESNTYYNPQQQQQQHGYSQSPATNADYAPKIEQGTTAYPVGYGGREEAHMIDGQAVAQLPGNSRER